MTKHIKMYNHSYKIANRILKESPKISLTYLVMQTMHQLPDQYNYSKEGVKWCWQDFHKPKFFRINTRWFNPTWQWNWPSNDYIDQALRDFNKLHQTKIWIDEYNLKFSPKSSGTFIIK